MTKASSVGISLPTDILSKIDTERGDIPRSRYILRVLQDTYSKRNQPEEEKRSRTANKIINRQDSPDRGIETPKARRIIKAEPIGAHATI